MPRLGEASKLTPNVVLPAAADVLHKKTHIFTIGWKGLPEKRVVLPGVACISLILWYRYKLELVSSGIGSLSILLSRTVRTPHLGRTQAFTTHV